MSAKTSDRIVTLDSLRNLPAPLPMGPRHVPVPHSVLVEELTQELAKRHLVPSHVTHTLSGGEAGADRLVSRFEFLDVAKRDAQRAALVASRATTYTGINQAAVQALLPAELRGSHGAAIMLDHAHDQSRRVRITAAQVVFICNNLAVAPMGEAVAGRKHTGDGDWAARIPLMVDRVLAGFTGFNRALDTMRNADLSDTQAKELIYNAFDAAYILPANKFLEVGRTYFDHATEDVGGTTRWDLHNAFTRAMRELPERRQMEGSAALTQLLTADILPLEAILPDAN